MDQDFSKFSNEYLQFAFEEADKALSESLVSYREIINKSYLAIAFYISALVFFIGHLKESEAYIFLSAISVVCILWIANNLFSSKMYSPGTEPSYTIHSYYQDKPDQIREVLISKIIHINEAIKCNYKEVGRRNNTFKWSAATFIIISIVSFFYILSRIR